MVSVRKLIKSIPFLYAGYRAARNAVDKKRLKKSDPAAIFTAIHKNNSWGGNASVSGRGSDLRQTRNVVLELPVIFRKLGVRSILDIPCGDFHWMSTVPMAGVDYTGADIVPALIRANSTSHVSTERKFVVKDLMVDEIPPVDLIFCRDCLVHLSFSDIERAIKNVCKSGARYLMTTTFTGRVANDDIMTGQWRPLNFELPPFSFPPPEGMIKEGCEESGGEFSDKTLGLWSVESLRRMPYVLGRPQK